jgi:hypothetical protein
MSVDKIFISIASYRDDQTVPTVIDCLKKAKFPSRLVFGICLQQDKNEIDTSYLDNHSQIKIINYHWKNSLGTCWARHQIQKQLISDETYYFQLDSHHRFAENWDEWLIDTYEELKEKYNKPIIGGYCPSYFASDDTVLADTPLQTNCHSDFTNETGDLFFSSREINNFPELREQKVKTVTAKFLSGHFIFTGINFCKECPYDPNLYFRGEELSLSVRAYTHGYDFFHPTYPIVWHEYIRKNKPKHWNDHIPKNGFVITAEQRSDKAKEKIRYLLGMEKSNINFQKYGLGNIRSIHDYELYAGLNFKTQQVHKYAYNILGRYPHPFTMTEEEWLSGLMNKFNIAMQLPDVKLTALLNSKPDNFYILCYDIENDLIYRKKINNLDMFNNKEKIYAMSVSMEKKPSKIYIKSHHENSQKLGEKLLINNFVIK